MRANYDHETSHPALAAAGERNELVREGTPAMIASLRTTALEYERKAVELQRTWEGTTDGNAADIIAERVAECANISLDAYLELRRIAQETAPWN